ncbi:MAG: single-stranded DNA-binding protein [Clostridia bacterium]|nr:single-stranded DNA-binding protein [Clostridia bacterium]
MINSGDNNKACLIGKVVDELIFNHEIYGEKFYTFTLCVPRLSETNDYIKVMVSERLLEEFPVYQGSLLEITGQFRSYNNSNASENKLILTLFAKDLSYADLSKNKNSNSIFLDGFICKEPIFRTTPFGREITDMLIAVNRTYNKSDYIPIIAWGRNARYCKNFCVGDNIRIWGRIQSRDYQKRISEDEIVTKTAYEVSISKLELVRAEEEVCNGSSAT